LARLYVLVWCHDFLSCTNSSKRNMSFWFLFTFLGAEERHEPAKKKEAAREGQREFRPRKITGAPGRLKPTSAIDALPGIGPALLPSGFRVHGLGASFFLGVRSIKTTPSIANDQAQTATIRVARQQSTWQGGKGPTQPPWLEMAVTVAP
jgi:hypothetical protein